MPAFIHPPRRHMLLAPFALSAARPARGQARPPVGAVAEAIGETEARFGNEARALSAAAPVLLEDTLRTGAASRLAVRLEGGIGLRLTAQASLRINRFVLEARGNTPPGLRLGAGPQGGLWLEGPAGAMPAAVDSAWALVAVRGTAFFAGEVDGRYAVFVQRGSVAVVAAEAAVVLEAGQGCEVAAPGAPPSQAVTWGAARVVRTLALVGL